MKNKTCVLCGDYGLFFVGIFMLLFFVSVIVASYFVNADILGIILCCIAIGLYFVAFFDFK